VQYSDGCKLFHLTAYLHANINSLQSSTSCVTRLVLLVWTNKAHKGNPAHQFAALLA